MNYKAVAKYAGQVLLFEALFMVPALLISLFKQEYSSVFGFGVAILAALIIGAVLSIIRFSGAIYAREGFSIVALSWILISIFGAIPFVLSGAIPNVIDAWFETVSGFTTTGSSILPEVESLPYGISYWRCFTHWLGGMGVLVFLLAVIPLSRGNGETMHILRAESPGPSVGKLTPTIRQTSRYLYAIYIVLTLLEIILLLAGGMPLFEAVTHSFATAGTGGFSVKNLSIGAYQSSYIHLVIGIFMALFGVNFSVYYLLLTRRFKAAAKNEEVRLYFIIMLVATVFIGINILPSYTDGGKAFLDSFFQVSSIMTTTGFATVDFNLWPQFSRFMIMLLMILGACAGSTGGGLKISRFLILIKYLKNKMQIMLRPRNVKSVHIDGKRVEVSVVHDVSAFLVAYCVICIVSMLIVSLDNFSTDTTITSVLSCLNNIGPGLDLVGPMGNFGSFSILSKIVLSLDMLFGRLEIFPMLFLFSPKAWQKNA